VEVPAKPSLLERIQCCCNSFSVSIDIVLNVLKVLAIFKANAKKFCPVLSVDVAEKALFYMAQQSDPELASVFKKKSSLPLRGPLLLSDSVVVFRCGLADGRIALQLVLPRSCSRLRELLARDLHHLSLHGSARSMLSLLRYHVPAFIPTVRRISLSCVTCQKLHARRRWDDLPAAGMNPEIGSAEWLSCQLPYTVVSIDFITLCDVIVFTMTCCFTKHTSWKIVKQQTTLESLRCVDELIEQYGSTRVILSDRGAYFSSSIFRKQLERRGITLHLLCARSPWTSCHEQMHHLGLQRLRALLAPKKWQA
jgi:hypothetical protein